MRFLVLALILASTCNEKSPGDNGMGGVAWAYTNPCPTGCNTGLSETTLSRLGLKDAPSCMCDWNTHAMSPNTQYLDAHACADDKACNLAAASFTFANLGTPTPFNGELRYCSDCSFTNSCTGGGTGAMARRENGAWNCGTTGGAAAGWTTSGRYVQTPYTPMRAYNTGGDQQSQFSYLVQNSTGGGADISMSFENLGLGTSESKLSFHWVPVLRRSSNVIVGQTFNSEPPLRNQYQVTTAGLTDANIQGVGFPVMRVGGTPLAIGARVVHGQAGTQDGFDFYWEVTSATGGACASDCSNAGTSCAANVTCTSCGNHGSNGCLCTTSITIPSSTCWSAPSGSCTFSDGSCNYTAASFSGTLNASDSITDGTAKFKALGTDASKGAPTVELGTVGFGDEMPTFFLAGDNKSYNVVNKTSYNWGLRPGTPSKGQAWSVAQGALPSSVPQSSPLLLAVGDGAQTGEAIISARAHPYSNASQDAVNFVNTAGYTDQVGQTPVLPPLVTVSAGGSLNASTFHCYAQAWQNRATGGITQTGPIACAKTTSTNKTITLTPQRISMSTNPWGAPLTVFAIITVSGDYYVRPISGVQSEYIGPVDGAADTLTLTAEVPESPTMPPISLTNDPVFEISESAAAISPWPSNTAIVVQQQFRPTAPWSVSPPVPFVYFVTATGCTTCKNCTGVFRGATGTTGSVEPTWRTDAGLFCDNNGVQYQKLFPYQATTAKYVNTNWYDASSSDGTTLNLDSNGTRVLYREFLGRPQYVCNAQAKPTCDVTKQGLLWYNCGATDTMQMCMSVSSAFAWHTITIP